MIEKRGVVSVWVGALRSRKHLEKYLEELYFDDEVHASVFAREFDLGGWDDYAIEARWSSEGTVAALLAPISHSASFAAEASAGAAHLGWTRATTVIVLYDLAIPRDERPAHPKQSMAFVGSYAYDARR